MKILQVNKLYYPWIGGMERMTQDIAEGLNKEKDFEVLVLVCQPRGKRRVEEINKVKVFKASSLGMFSRIPISFDFFLLFKKLSSKVDILHIHHPFPLADLALFLFPTKAKIVVHYHSDIVRQKIFEVFIRPFLYHTLKKSSKILVSNPNLIKTSPILQKFSSKCVVVPFGVPLSKYQNPNIQKVKKIRQKYGNFVLFVGRLSYYKGVSYLIKAIKGIPTNLVIIGDGPERNRIQRLVEKLHITSKVYFLPFQKEEDLICFYHACKFLILPSIYRSEAFGLVLIEAMACKKPVISTELGTGTSWVNENNITGFVVKAKDRRSLKKAIEKLLFDEDLYQKFSNNAFLRTKKHFREETMIKKIKEVYLKTIQLK